MSKNLLESFEQEESFDDSRNTGAKRSDSQKQKSRESLSKSKADEDTQSMKKVKEMETEHMQPIAELVYDPAGTCSASVKDVKDSVSEGSGIAKPLTKHDVFPDMVVQMIAVGEDTGALDSMLSKIADFYDQEAEATTESLMALLEPIMILVLGGIVGGMIIAMYMPIFKIFEANLTKAVGTDSPCKDQFTPVGTHYTVYNGTVVHGVPHVLSVEVDLFAPGPV